MIDFDKLRNPFGWSCFVHNPKTGGSSFKESLARPRTNTCAMVILGHSFCYDVNFPYIGFDSKTQLYDFNGKPWGQVFQRYDPTTFDCLFSLVRNPFKILPSCYYHTHPHSDESDGWCCSNLIHGFQSWEEYLEAYIDKDFEWHIPPFKRSLFCFSQNFQGDFVLDGFLKIEEPEIVNEVLEVLDCEPMPKINKTKNKPEKAFYTKSQVNELSKIWDRDLNFLGYECPKKLIIE